jgi:hypothetical protein
MSERQFDESEIGPILQRASELQAGLASGAGSGLTLSELQRLASEVGIDPVMVERAAREKASQPIDPIIDERATSILLDQTVDGRLTDEDWEDVVADLRHYTRRPGTTRQRGSAMEWTFRSDSGGVTFSASRRGDQTRLRLMGDLAAGVQTAWAIGPIISSVVAIMAGALLYKQGGNPVLAFLLTFSIMALAALATYLGVRAWTRKERADLRALFERAATRSKPALGMSAASLLDQSSEQVNQNLG